MATLKSLGGRAETGPTEPDASEPGGAPGGMLCPYLRGAATLGESEKASCTHGSRPFKVHSGYQRVYCRTSRYERCDVFTGQADQPLAPAGGGRRSLPAPRPSRPRKRVVAVVSVLAGAATAAAVVLIASSGALPTRFSIDSIFSSDSAPTEQPAEQGTPAAVTPPVDEAPAEAESDAVTETPVDAVDAEAETPPITPVDAEAAEEPTTVTPEEPEATEEPTAVTPVEPEAAEEPAAPTETPPPAEVIPGPSSEFLADLYAFYAGLEALSAESAAEAGEETVAEPEIPRDPRLPADAAPAEGSRFVRTASESGVRHRSDCTVDARLETGWLEGTRVTLLGEGVGRCAGWYFAEGGEFTSWIRADWLSLS